MRHLNYERLTSITKNTSPYRGSDNRFPIGSRTHNNKYFLVEELEGQKVYRIIYGTSWSSQDISHEDYLIAKSNQDPYVYERENISYESGKAESLGRVYRRSIRKPNQLGIVRPDNTFEFTKPHDYGYGQGEKQIMSAWSNGWLYSDSRRGGMVYMTRNMLQTSMIPVWQGMRVDCETFKPICDFQLVGRRVSRKSANSLLNDYKDFYKCADTMFQAMDTTSLLELTNDILAELKVDLGGWRFDCTDEILQIAQDKMKTAPIDSAIIYCLIHDVDRLWRRAQSHRDPNRGYYGNREIDTSQLFTKLRAKLNKSLYRANESVFKEVQYVPYERYPASEWGLTVIADGKEVQQYC